MPVAQQGDKGLCRSSGAENAVAPRTRRFVTIGQPAFGKPNHCVRPVILELLGGTVSSRANPSSCSINAKLSVGWSCLGCRLVTTSAFRSAASCNAPRVFSLEGDSTLLSLPGLRRERNGGVLTLKDRATSMLIPSGS
jgi:hypothetical protein